jgi:L-ascorbate 6-phosphate lactonase
MLSGNDLIADIDNADVPDGKVGFWWLGQHSFVLKLSGRVIYVDPFLSPSPQRLVPPLVAAKDMTHADLILGTHDHGDHIDRKSWPQIADSTEATFVVPEFSRPSIIEDLAIPESRVAGVNDGTSIEFDDIRITGIAGAHEFLDQDPETGCFPWLGYVVEANGCKVYHAGDTVKYEGLEARLAQHTPIDLALLPINGRDATRFANDIIGNMTYQEAVDLAGAIEPRLVVPTHYDMFDGNLEDPTLFVDYLKVKFPQREAHICQYGERGLV